jgi:hypothetical protein
MAQCSKTTNTYGVLGLLKGQGGRCSRRATYTDGTNLFCTQHAKVEATALAPAKNKIRPECRPISEQEQSND